MCFTIQLKRLRELANIVVDSDTSATLPSNGNDVSGTSGDASAASASVTSHEPNEMNDLKENIDQVKLIQKCFECDKTSTIY